MSYGDLMLGKPYAAGTAGARRDLKVHKPDWRVDGSGTSYGRGRKRAKALV